MLGLTQARRGDQKEEDGRDREGGGDGAGLASRVRGVFDQEDRLGGPQGADVLEELGATEDARLIEIALAELRAEGEVGHAERGKVRRNRKLTRTQATTPVDSNSRGGVQIAANSPLTVQGARFVLEQGENLNTDQSLLLNGVWTMITSL